jgi:RHS repeat-associated protein
MFNQAQATTSVGTAYVYGDGPIPTYALMGEYDNGSATGKGRTEYIWLPMEGGLAIPVGIFRNGRLFAIHTDHLATPRLVTDDAGAPVWQWAYSAFGDNKPTGMLKAATNPKHATTNSPVLLKATKPEQQLDLRYPGQYFDTESGFNYNTNRMYDSLRGRYTQFDPIGLRGGPNGYVYAGANPLTFTDPMGLKHKASSAHCKALQKKIDNLMKNLDDRWADLAEGGLPERLANPKNEPLSATMRGHRTLINDRDSVLRKWEKRYSDECEPDDPPSGGTCDECTAGAVAATMVGGYLVYRCVRMLPSLLPPLWWTIPANAVTP